MSTVPIRRAMPQDAPVVATIFEAARSTMTYLPAIHTPADTNTYLSSLVHRGTVWIAANHQTVAGFMDLHGGWLNHLYVHPAFQQQGIGSALIHAAKRCSPDGLRLWVFEQNSGAIRLYEREGFILEDRRNAAQADNEEQLPDRRYRWIPPAHPAKS